MVARVLLIIRMLNGAFGVRLFHDQPAVRTVTQCPMAIPFRTANRLFANDGFAWTPNTGSVTVRLPLGYKKKGRYKKKGGTNAKSPGSLHGHNR
jgi:hypothetical protein